jgi:pimeloyl-ACP methyl ester carboxylesterase
VRAALPYIQGDGVQLYAEETGSGPPIVWLHEFAADLRTWEGQVRRFSRDYRCITYNARGYPPSDVPDTDDVYTYDWEYRDLRAILDGFGIDRAHIVGLSMGAYTGLQFALQSPDRVTSLLFASGGSGAPRGQREKFMNDSTEAAERMRRDGMAAAASGIANGATRIQLRNKDPRGWEEFRRYLGEHSAAGSALTMRNFQARRPSLYDFEAVLRDLDIPVLLAVGDEDDPVIETNVFLKRVLPRAGLWVCPKTGHGINLEEPDSFNEMAARFFAAAESGRWLRRDPGAAPGP